MADGDAPVRTLLSLFPHLTEHGDVVDVEVVRKGSHEPVAEAGLPDAHGPLLTFPTREAHHAYCDELAGTADCS